MGMVVYGGWFWLAQSVQSLASESARAAIGGLDAAERASLDRGFVAASDGGSALDLTRTAVVLESDAEAIRVRGHLGCRRPSPDEAGDAGGVT